MLLLGTCIALLVTSAAVDGTDVQVKRSLTYGDNITFSNTNDRSVCNTYGAIYSAKRSYANSVVCYCPKSKSVFYSVNANQKPSCYKPNANNLGCTSCEDSCFSRITTKATPIYWHGHIDSFKCHTSGRYTIQKWNGKNWEDFERFNDFSVSFGTTKINETTRSTAELSWDHLSVNTAYSDYKGHLFLITIYCSEKKLVCFLARAAGTQFYQLFAQDAPPVDENKSKSKTPAIGIGVASVIFLVLLISIISCYVCKKRKSKKQSRKEEETNPDPTAPAYVVPNVNVQQPPPPNPSAYMVSQPPPLQQVQMQQQPVTHMQIPMQPVAHQPMMTQQQIIQHPPAQVTQWHQMPMQSSAQIIPQTSQVMYAAPNHNVIVHPVAAPMSYGPQVVFPGKKGKRNKFKVASNTMGRVSDGIDFVNNVSDLAGGLGDFAGGFFE